MLPSAASVCVWESRRKAAISPLYAIVKGFTQFKEWKRRKPD